MESLLLMVRLLSLPRPSNAAEDTPLALRLPRCMVGRVGSSTVNAAQLSISIYSCHDTFSLPKPLKKKTAPAMMRRRTMI
jgi:hypothetical protein